MNNTIATFIFVDRRKTGRGKSLPNRQKLLKRIKDSIRAAKPEDIDSAGVQKSVTSGPGAKANPVKVARHAMNEPYFQYAARTGEREVVLIGNDRWLKGDEFPVSGGDGEGDGEGSGSGAGDGDDGEDDFVVNISRDEFYEVFFEDCELPDMKETHEKETPEARLKPAGFQREGTPGQLSVIRSYRNSLSRRKALTFDARNEVLELMLEQEELQKDLEEQQARLDENILDASANARWKAADARLKVIQERLRELQEIIGSVPMFEKVDRRYRKSERVLMKSADAVLIMAMDISGSMLEEHKRIARKFFALQYAFISRKYPNTDLIFIIHTTNAEEVGEEEFFTSRKNGGTVISSSVKLAHQIVKERYDSELTNIYFSYAGDGDNWDDDNRLVLNEFEDQGFLSKLRHAVYAQVGPEESGWSSTGPQKMWNVIRSIQNTTKKIHPVKIREDTEVFNAFKSVYGTSKGKK